MQSSFYECASGLDAAADAIAEIAFGAQRDDGSARIFLVASLQRCLQCADFFGVHPRDYARRRTPFAHSIRQETTMKRRTLTVPELMFVVGTRAALAAGAALLISGKLILNQRHADGL